MRKPIIIGNWKMNKLMNETIDFFDCVDKRCDNLNIDVGIAVPFVNLITAKKKSKNIFVVAQNCYFEDYGAFTGEISVKMLKDIEVNYVIIGHSERRNVFNETDDFVNKKIRKVLEENMFPIICCGENFEQYENGETEKAIMFQVEKALEGINIKYIKNVIIAYEPVWAIGTGKIPAIETSQNVCRIIRKKIADLYNYNIANTIRIQYGGSVNMDNIRELLSQPDIDGVLVGGASLEADYFLKLISSISSIIK